MKKRSVLLIVFLLFTACAEIKDDEEPAEQLVKQSSQKIELHDSMVVTIFTTPPGAESAAYGTGIVVDKENGLILTALHGVYHGSVNNYKNEGLFKNVRVVDKNNKYRVDGYVVHLSTKYDLAIIKVDRQLDAQAVFTSSDFLKVKDELDFWGYPDRLFKTLRGYISNISEKYLGLDMNVAEGMSGGPVFIQGKGIVGIILLKQKIGGTALRSEFIVDYLKQALPQARKVKKKSYSLCLKKIIFNGSQTNYNKKEEPDLYARVSVNGQELMETKKIEVTGDEMKWNSCIDKKNKFEITLLPGDKVEFKILRYYIYSVVYEKVLIEEVFEELPQKGLPDLDTEINIDGNVFFFESIE